MGRCPHNLLLCRLLALDLCLFRLKGVAPQQHCQVGVLSPSPNPTHDLRLGMKVKQDPSSKPQGEMNEHMWQDWGILLQPHLLDHLAETEYVLVGVRHERVGHVIRHVGQGF